MIKTIKHKINLILRKHKIPIIYGLLTKINLFIFQRDERQHKVCYGNDNFDITFLVIRPRGVEEGLLSLFFYVMRQLEYADKKNYIPIIDMKNYKCQYNVNDTDNAWEYFFSQPIGLQYSLEEIYQSKNVIMSGWTFFENYKGIFNFKYSDLLNSQRNQFIYSHLEINQSLLNSICELKGLYLKGINLGVYIRGTDYISFKPKGHPVQPSLNDYIVIINEFLAKYKIDKIFLVTEDYDIFTKIIDYYGVDKVVSINNNYIKNYNGKDYLNHYSCDDANKRIQGELYLCKMCLLTKCEYLITSITNGSLFTLALQDNDYKAKYIFDLGIYH